MFIMKVSDTRTTSGLRIIVFEDVSKTVIRITRPYKRDGIEYDRHVVDTTVLKST